MFYRNLALRSISVDYFDNDSSVIIHTIGNFAFSECQRLETLQLPAHITTLGTHLFTNCFSLSGNINLPNGLTSVSNLSFLGPISPNVTFSVAPRSTTENLLTNRLVVRGLSPSSAMETTCLIQKQNDKAVLVHGGQVQNLDFRLNGWLTGEAFFDVPIHIRTIQSYAFKNNTTLVSLNLPPYFEAAGESAFENCANLQSVSYTVADVLANTRTIAKKAFYGCTSLTTFDFIEDATVGDYAFAKCTNLQCYTQGQNSDSVGDYGNYVFSDCTSLVNICLYTAGNLGVGLFENCPNLSNIKIIGFGSSVPTPFCKFFASTDLAAEEDNFYIARPYYYDAATDQIKNDLYYKIPRTLAKITFNYNLDSLPVNSSIGFFSGLASVQEINHRINTIADYCFYGCTNLSLVLKSGAFNITKIGNYSFAGCYNLKDLDSTDHVTEIGEKAFKNSGVHYIDLPQISTINSSAFDNSSIKLIILNNKTVSDLASMGVASNAP